jgi:hypothetical protein
MNFINESVFKIAQANIIMKIILVQVVIKIV